MLKLQEDSAGSPEQANTIDDVEKPDTVSVVVPVEPAFMVNEEGVAWMDGADETTVNVSAAFAAATGDSPSLTCTAKLYVPGSVGVPDIVPLVLSERPDGSEPPITLHVKGERPEVSASVC